MSKETLTSMEKTDEVILMEMTNLLNPVVNKSSISVNLTQAVNVQG